MFMLVNMSLVSAVSAQTTVDDQEVQNILNEIDAEIQKWAGENPTTSAAELDQAVSFLYDGGITKYNNKTDFRYTDSIRRDEAAAMYKRLADAYGRATLDPNKSCSFEDINEGHSDLKQVVTDSCKAGLFQGSKGKFMPTASITKGQAVVVIMRMIEGMKDESGAHYADNYVAAANARNLLDGLNINSSTYEQAITRGDVAIILYRAGNQLQ